MATKAGNLTSLKSLVESEFTNNVDDEILPREFSSKVNIFCKTGDLILYWSETEKCIYSTKVKNFNDDREQQEIQKLVCSVSPAFAVTSIKCSSNGQHALIFGPNNVGVIELPRRWGEEGIFENGKNVIHCRLTMLDESFFMHHLSTKILQAAWYNGSPASTHVVVLCSDNCLRFYDVSMPEQPIVRLPLFDQTESTRLGSLASITSAVLGSNGVDFDQGEVIHEEDGTDTYPLYLMQENGDVWLVKCKFSHNRFLVKQQGPLTMNPPSQDNYGCDYCSLICLSSNPTIVVMATESGTLHHCLVMESDVEESEDELRLTRSTILIESCEALYVYESVQLELTFLNQQSEDEMGKFSNLQLVKDSSKNDSYLVTSNGGLHTVYLPWMNDLESFMSGDLVMQSSVEIESPAEVAYLLCTQPSDESPRISICGCSLLQDSQMEPFVCCLLSNGHFVNLDFIRNIKSIVGGSTGKMANSRQEFASPLRSLKGVGGFDVYMAKILSKSATVPLLRTGGGEQTIPADTYYKLLTKTTQILREEYMQKMLQAKGELEKRCKLLRMKKDEQLEELQHLQENSNLIERGEELASKLETAQEKMHFITERICKVLRNIQTSSPVLSTEEAEWSKELKIMKEKLLKMKRFSEVIHTKHENFVLQSIPDKAVKNESAKTSSLSTAQAIKVRAVLKEQEKAISQLVDDVQDLNLRVS